MRNDCERLLIYIVVLGIDKVNGFVKSVGSEKPDPCQVGQNRGMNNDVISVRRRAEDLFERVLQAVPEDGWNEPSACEHWTILDVVSHAWPLTLPSATAPGRWRSARSAPEEAAEAPSRARNGRGLGGRATR